MTSSQLILKRMGVLNCTPNSFSDGGELTSLESLKAKIETFGQVEAVDLGAESTAPMNKSISWDEEWDRLKRFLPELRNFPGVLSIDTYHPETIQNVIRLYYDEGYEQELIWNDVSGKFDQSVKDFLKSSQKFSYVFCHNLAPARDLSGRHMDFIDSHLTLESLAEYFQAHKHPRVIFDPCLGFSKTYEQNWLILNNFSHLQKMVDHPQWLLGFSRKSFLRKKFGFELSEKEKLDQVHVKVLQSLGLRGDLWIRTHRPELI